MGVFSKHNRYREAGEMPNVNNVEEYGAPAYSLFTSTKIFTIHHHIDITDAGENIVYQSVSKAVSIKNKTDIIDARGNNVAHIERKIVSLHERHYVTMDDGTSFELSNELFHLIKDITNIEGLGWQMRGNILGLNFQLYDQNHQIVAVISQKMISMHNKYCIDIYRPEYEKYIVAILITLQLMIYDRQVQASASSSSTYS